MVFIAVGADINQCSRKLNPFGQLTEEEADNPLGSAFRLVNLFCWRQILNNKGTRFTKLPNSFFNIISFPPFYTAESIRSADRKTFTNLDLTFSSLEETPCPAREKIKALGSYNIGTAPLYYCLAFIKLSATYKAHCMAIKTCSLGARLLNFDYDSFFFELKNDWARMRLIFLFAKCNPRFPDDIIRKIFNNVAFEEM